MQRLSSPNLALVITCPWFIATSFEDRNCELDVISRYLGCGVIVVDIRFFVFNFILLLQYAVNLDEVFFHIRCSYWIVIWGGGEFTSLSISSLSLEKIIEKHGRYHAQLSLRPSLQKFSPNKQAFSAP